MAVTETYENPFTLTPTFNAQLRLVRVNVRVAPPVNVFYDHQPLLSGEAASTPKCETGSRRGRPCIPPNQTKPVLPHEITKLQPRDVPTKICNEPR